MFRKNEENGCPCCAVINIPLPEAIHTVLRKLNESGYAAYAVGGCVRDSLLGRPPKDWDVTTSALPPEIHRAFSDKTVVDTGIRHGTVTVVMNGLPVEITTYRVDGAYSDHRRPDQVRFTSQLREDLSRRDFTVNAMAYHPDQGLWDFFEGRDDCRRKIVRCVGDPAVRFEEDALRILRALRFASELGFLIDPETEKQLLRKRELLRYVAVERISSEFVRLCCGERAGEILRDNAPVIDIFLPELPSQDRWQHTLRGLKELAPVPHLRLAMLFRDVGGEDEVRRILTRLRLDGQTVRRVCTLVRYHGAHISCDIRDVKRWMRTLTPPVFSDLLHIRRAELLARGGDPDGLRQVETLFQLMERVLAEHQCFSLRDLAVSGRDLLRIGWTPGRPLGEQLERLLNAVTDGELANERETLLSEARRQLELQCRERDH